MALSLNKAPSSVVASEELLFCRTSYHVISSATEINALNFEPVKRRRVLNNAELLTVSMVAVGASPLGSERIVMQEDGKAVYPLMHFQLEELVVKDWVGKLIQFAVDRIQLSLCWRKKSAMFHVDAKICTSYGSFWLFGFFHRR